MLDYPRSCLTTENICFAYKRPAADIYKMMYLWVKWGKNPAVTPSLEIPLKCRGISISLIFLV